MATSRRNQNYTYRTYGSVAYAPAYDGSAVRAPGHEQVLQPKPKQKRKVKTLTRTQVQVREAGLVSPFAVVGFAMVGVFASLLLLSYTQYAMMADQVVSLRRELSALQTENATLSAEYERVFDLNYIQGVVGQSMVRPSANQVEYIDLSAPDSVELYLNENRTTGIVGALDGIGEVISDVIEYFR